MYAINNAITKAKSNSIAPSPAKRRGVPLFPLEEITPAASPDSGKWTVTGTLARRGGFPLSVATTAKLAIPLYPPASRSLSSPVGVMKNIDAFTPDSVKVSLSFLSPSAASILPISSLGCPLTKNS